MNAPVSQLPWQWQQAVNMVTIGVVVSCTGLVGKNAENSNTLTILQQYSFGLFFYSKGSGCPLPRRAKHTTASAIPIPIAVPNAAIPASAI